MARFKPSGAQKPKTGKSGKGKSYIGCIIIIVAGFALVFWMFYELMKSTR
ncbi:MAG: hypothetical protein JO307_00875 [Bryobacterales bacterium]|nr:hypothetical protein [Bryobacterales bacterium]MBV9398007.1 hypothetical protein [Bryobacterales bacterium]